MNFWYNLPQPFFVLAPMEDVTDTVFRQVVARAGRPDVFVTEFMNVSGFTHPTGRESVARRLKYASSEQPIVAQIWGNRPDDFAQTAHEIAQMDFAGIDINMGCPDKAVVRSGGGAALIQNPELASEIIDAVKRVAQKKRLPISVKTRVGFSRADEWRGWLTTLLEQDLDALTVHLRTRREMSRVPAHRELIPDIVKLRDKVAPHAKLIINGDIRDRTDGLKLADENTGVDGLMIGRGVFANPFCFEPYPRQHDRAELIELLKYHLDLFDTHGDARKFEPLKKFFKIYINNFPGAADLRAKLMTAKNTDTARQIIKEVIK